MIRIALIICVVNAFIGLTVNTDRPARMCYGTCENPRVASVPEALAAGVILAAGMFSRHHNVPLAAVPVIVVGTIFHGTT